MPDTAAGRSALVESGLPWFECGVSIQPFPGEATSGDGYVVQPFEGGVLLGAVDGLGHGPEAAEAAQVAVATLAARAHEPVIALVHACHAALKATRGVVMCIAALDIRQSTLTWVSVGNVETQLLRGDPASRPQRETVLPRGGVVGYQLPLLRAEILPIKRGDLLLFATDGVQPDFAGSVSPGLAPQELADSILSRFGKSTDDALVLAARYRGGSP